MKLFFSLLLFANTALACNDNSLMCDIFQEQAEKMGMDGLAPHIQMCRYRVTACQQFKKRMAAKNAASDEAQKLNRDFHYTPAGEFWTDNPNE